MISVSPGNTEYVPSIPTPLRALQQDLVTLLDGRWAAGQNRLQGRRAELAGGLDDLPERCWQGRTLRD